MVYLIRKHETKIKNVKAIPVLLDTSKSGVGAKWGNTDHCMGNNIVVLMKTPKTAGTR